MERKIKIQPVGVTLGTFRFTILVISPPKRRTPRDAFQINAPTATCTIVNDQIGKTYQQAITKSI